MNKQQSKSFGQTDKNRQEGNLFQSFGQMQNDYAKEQSANIEFTFVLKKLFLSIKKLFVAIKYQFFKVTGGAFDTFRMPWLKVGLILLLGFLMFKKDFQFTINMSAPRALLPYDKDEKDNSDVSQLGIAQAVAQYERVKNPFADQKEDDKKTLRDKAYIRRFQSTAREEMEQFGIPASIKMAQGLLESGSGTSRLAKNNNNHFGIKCFSKKCAKNHCSNHSDDHHKDFFRIYKTSWESWRAHSKLLTSKHYTSLKENGGNYKDWAYGLKKLGYATDPKYSEKLIEKIEKYKLYYLDK